MCGNRSKKSSYTPEQLLILYYCHYFLATYMIFWSLGITWFIFLHPLLHLGLRFIAHHILPSQSSVHNGQIYQIIASCNIQGINYCIFRLQLCCAHYKKKIKIHKSEPFWIWFWNFKSVNSRTVSSNLLLAFPFFNFAWILKPPAAISVLSSLFSFLIF